VVQRVYDAVQRLATNRAKPRYFDRRFRDIVCGFYNVKSSVKLSAILLMLLVGCTASHAAPKRPWRVEVKTDGGFAGRGIGTYVLGSDASATAELMNGKGCTFTLSADELSRFESILATARPETWKESYVTENTCCDRILYDLMYEEAGERRTTRWIDAPLPMPADLVALSNAIVGGDATSIRMLAAERCK
jgi:hypothetical protein